MGSTVVVSLRSKGIPGCTPSALFHWRTHVLALINEVSDLLAALVITTLNLSWTAWLSLFITLLVMIVNAAKKSINPSVVVFFPLLGYIVLPLIVLLYLVVQRRDRAQAGLSKFKVFYVAMKLQATALSLPTAANPSLSLQVQPRPQQHEATGDSTAQPGLQQAPSLRAYPSDVAQASQDLQVALLTLQDDLHKYLAHNRPYARHFYVPYRPERIKSEALYKVSRQLGLLSRKLQRSMRETIVCVGCLREAISQAGPTPLGTTAWPSHPPGHSSTSLPVLLSPGARPAPGGNHTQQYPQGLASHGFGPPTMQAAGQAGWGGAWPAPAPYSCVSLLLGQQVVELHQAVEDLMSIKEQHTPVLLRAVIRWFAGVIFPVLLGWYWLAPAREVAPGTGVIMAVVCQVGLMVVVDTVTSLEDPFDPVALDAVSCLEMMDGARVMSGVSDDPGDLPGAASDDDEALQVKQQPTSIKVGKGGQAGGGSAGSSPRQEGIWMYGAGLDQQVSMPPMPPLPVPQSTYAPSPGLGMPAPEAGKAAG